MTGSERTRFCQQCGLHVYNISELSHREALTLINETQGRLCGRLYRRADGTVLTKDCPVGLRALRRRAARIAGASLAAILSLFSVGAGQKRSGDSSGKNISIHRIAAANSRITVVVLDPIGAVVPNATITLTDFNTHATVKVGTTSDSGEFAFSDLKAGVYALSIEARGFAPFRLKSLSISDQEEIAIKTTMAFGEMTETVGILMSPVDESTPNTKVITKKQIDSFPW